MTTPAPTRATRGLVDELLRSHRFTAVALGAMLALSLLTSGYLILVSQPRLTQYVEMTKLARDGHEGMLDQETGLRGWLATGDKVFLQPYENGRGAADTAFGELLASAKDSPEFPPTVVATLVARARWREWATEAAGRRMTTAQLTDGTLRAFLLEGKQRFDDYRAADTVSLDQLKAGRIAALRHETQALVAVFVSYLVLVLVAGLLFLRRRRQMQATVLEPMRSLLATIEALHRGDLTARTAPTDVPELHEIGTELDQLAQALDEASRDASQREQRLALLASRFETVVRVGREISGSLSVRYVAAAVTSAASDLLDSTATLWVRGEDQAFHAIHRSQDPHGAVPPPHLVAPPVVLHAAGEARPVAAANGRAYPLVLAGMVTGVLEVSTESADSDVEQVLDALLSTAAVALESAHLHSSARELADMDGLTQLSNRRRFEVDIDNEWERCRRYGRPMSLVMLDLDHFKTLNDEHGHLVGDQVLRQVSTALGATLRNTDTAYRYGGEELVVLLRETGLEDAGECAERMRVAIAQVTLAGHPQVFVSASAGVGMRHAAMSHHTELIAVADGALYEAKRLGRNRVVASGRGPLTVPEVLFQGEAADVDGAHPAADPVAVTSSTTARPS